MNLNYQQSPVILSNRPRGISEDKDRVSTACVACRRNHQSCDSVKPCQRCVSKNIECLLPEVKTRGVKSRKRTVDYPDPYDMPSMYDITNPEQMNASLNFGIELNDFAQQYLGDPLSSSSDFGSSGSYPEFSSSISPPLDYSPDLEQNKLAQEAAPGRFWDNNPPIQTSSCEEQMKKIGFQKTAKHQQLWDRYITKVNMLREWVTVEQKEMLERNYETQRDALILGSDEMLLPVIIWGRCGIIIHVNKVLRELTGFNTPTPCSMDGQGVMGMLSKDTIIRKFENFITIFSGVSGTYIDPQAKMRKYQIGAEQEEYVEGTLAVSVKRDIFELPHLFHAVFVPGTNGQSVVM